MFLIIYQRESYLSLWRNIVPEFASEVLERHKCLFLVFFGLLCRNLEALRGHSDPSRVHSPGTVPNQTA